MAEASMQQIVEVLRSRLGARWEGSEADGRDEMSKALQDELGYDKAQANAAIAALIESGTLRYHRPAAADTDTGVMPLPAAPLGTGGPAAVPSGTAGAPVMPVAPVAPGYWQIGGEEASGMSGRKGQVDPTA
jgi:hypothetical protein